MWMRVLLAMWLAVLCVTGLTAVTTETAPEVVPLCKARSRISASSVLNVGVSHHHQIAFPCCDRRGTESFLFFYLNN